MRGSSIAILKVLPVWQWFKWAFDLSECADMHSFLMSHSHFKVMSYLVTSPWQHHRKRTCVCLTESLLDQLQEEQRWLISYGPTCIDMCLAFPLFSPLNKTILTPSVPVSPLVFLLAFIKMKHTESWPTYQKGLRSLTQEWDKGRKQVRSTGRQRERERMSNLTHPGMKWCLLCIMTLCMETEPSVGFGVDCSPAETSPVHMHTIYYGLSSLHHTV